ncbi:MAG: chalcone isomerase family protein [Nevskia sp.]|nr:chalcone isomerase family protein [Nevskia sp.]
MKNTVARCCVAVLLLVGAPAPAVQLAGVNVDDQVTVDGNTLMLNGAGLRTKYLLADVYLAALYLPQKSGDAGEIVEAREPRRISLMMKRDIDTAALVKAFHEGVSRNLSAAQLAALKPRLERLDRSFAQVRALRSGDVITLDFGADGSTRVRYNGQLQDSIEGADLSAALLGIWLGRNPVQADLKRELLGG